MQKRIVLFVQLLIVLGFTAPLIAGPDKHVRLQIMGGVFSPVENAVHDIYGSTAFYQIHLVAPITAAGRVRFGVSYLQSAGDPYFSISDFNAGDAGRLQLGSAALIFEISGKKVLNPKIYVGAGISYFTGEERIRGVSDNTGDGLGAVFTLSPEFRLNERLFFTLEAGLRLVEIRFRQAKQRYTLNLSGGTLALGLAYVLGR